MTRARVAGRGVGAALLAAVVAVGVSAPSAVASPVPGSAPARSEAAGVPGGVDTGCLQRAAVGSCRLGVNPAGAGTPYELAVPVGVTQLTVLLSGGRGANGDGSATGGAGGLTVATVPVPAGGTLEVHVASGASSTTPGTGWRSGGSGVAASGAVEGDSGGGGGASAVLVAGAAAPLVVAGGGGGAGGTVNQDGEGGNGGPAGLPAGGGAEGTGPNYTSPGTSTTYPGGGGCANGSSCGVGGSESDGNGGDGGSRFFQEGGGGGGAGWPDGGGGGGSARLNATNPLEFAGGGGGAGGQNYVAPGGTTIATGSTSGQDGSVTFLPAGASSTFGCGRTTTWTAPAGTGTVIGVAVGATGGSTSNPGNSGAPGSGALAVGELPVTAGQQLAVTPGCGGYGQDPSPGLGYGGTGGNAPAYNADDGGGGGGGSTISTTDGTPLLTAGGGGGSGGYAMSAFTNALKPSAGGHGGTAGLGWGEAGAGKGGGGGTYGDQYPQGGPSANPSGAGDSGSSGSDVPASGGGGGGGGGLPFGGRGGSTSDAEGGGGGTAGQSSYASTVTGPRIGTSSGTVDGTVVLIAVPFVVDPVPYDNTGIERNFVPSNPVGGFDGNGTYYDEGSLEQSGLHRGVPVTVGDVVLTWPDVGSGQPDNYLSRGQTLPVTGAGSSLVLLGAATYGPATGTGNVTYADGTTSAYTVTFGDWRGAAATGSTTVASFTYDDGLLMDVFSVYAATLPITPGKAVRSVTLPDTAAAQGTPTLHFFDVAVGGRDNQGISANPGDGGTGFFDGGGNAYDPAGLATAGLEPGAAFTALGASGITWPAGAPGTPDNYVAQGQRIAVSGSGDRLVVVGASSYSGAGGVSGTAAVTYTDGTKVLAELGLPDWAAGYAAPGQQVLATVEANPRSNDLSVLVFATSIPLDPSKSVAAITLPAGPPVSAGTPAMHVFALGVGGTAAPRADLQVSLDVHPAGAAAQSAARAGEATTLTVRVDHRGGSDTGPYGTAVLLPAGVDPVDLGGGTRLGLFVVFTGARLRAGGSDTRTLTVTTRGPGTVPLAAATASTTPDPLLLNNITVALLTTR